jgi:acyl dehydratase
MESKFGNFYEDFIIDETINHALSKTIFESDNNLFSLLTMNHHPVHLNAHFVEKHQHGKILVVGTLVFSITVGITVGDISGKAIANLEYESVKHLHPVFINDTLYVRTKIIDKWETSKDDRGVVYVESITKNQNNIDVLIFRRKVLIPKNK